MKPQKYKVGEKVMIRLNLAQIERLEPFLVSQAAITTYTVRGCYYDDENHIWCYKLHESGAYEVVDEPFLIGADAIEEDPERNLKSLMEIIDYSLEIGDREMFSELAKQYELMRMDWI